MKQEKHRRRYLVNTRYQLTQAGVAIAANLLVALLMAALMSWFYLLSLNRGLAANHNQLFPVYLSVAALMVIVFSTFWSLRRSRIVAGMMRKLDLILRDAARGVFPDAPLVFRKGDYFAWLAQPLNECFLQLRKRQELQEVTASALRELQRKIADGKLTSDGVARKIDEILAGMGISGKDENGRGEK